MNTRIVHSNRFGILAPARLVAFEETLGASLPEPYRAHMLDHNGGYVRGARQLNIMHHVFGIHNGPDWARFPDRARIYDGLVPQRLLPIADDPGGNLICISLSGSDRGAICFWDHERASDPIGGVTMLAPDFAAFSHAIAVKYAIARKRIQFVKKAATELGVNEPIYAGKTILDLAIERGSFRMVKMLVQAGSRIGPDAIIEAVRNNAINTVRFILSQNIDVNYAIPETGFTPLMLAASGDAIDVAKLLLDAGANLTPKNRWGKTAFELAHTPQLKQLLTSG